MIETRPQKYDRARAKTAERFLLKLKIPRCFCENFILYSIFSCVSLLNRVLEHAGS